MDGERNHSGVGNRRASSTKVEITRNERTGMTIVTEDMPKRVFRGDCGFEVVADRYPVSRVNEIVLTRPDHVGSITICGLTREEALELAQMLNDAALMLDGLPDREDSQA